MSLCLEDHFYVSIQCTLCQSPRQKHWVILMIWVICATVSLLLICINYSLIAQSVVRVQLGEPKYKKQPGGYFFCLLFITAGAKGTRSGFKHIDATTTCLCIRAVWLVSGRHPYQRTALPTIQSGWSPRKPIVGSIDSALVTVLGVICRWDVSNARRNQS